MCVMLVLLRCRSSPKISRWVNPAMPAERSERDAMPMPRGRNHLRAMAEMSLWMYVSHESWWVMNLSRCWIPRTAKKQKEVVLQFARFFNLGRFRLRPSQQGHHCWARKANAPLVQCWAKCRPVATKGEYCTRLLPFLLMFVQLMPLNAYHAHNFPME